MSEDIGIPMTEASDAEPAQLGFGKGGVPWLLLLFYLSFLVFFVFYALEYQLPDYLDQGPAKPAAESPSDP